MQAEGEHEMLPRCPLPMVHVEIFRDDSLETSLPSQVSSLRLFELYIITKV